MINYTDIKKVHLEISTRCNAACPLCPRNLAGYDADLGYPIHSMTLAEAKNIFTVPFLQQLDKLLINGNFGDFVTAKDGLEIVRYFSESNPKLQLLISTNGSARSLSWWAALGAIPNLTIGFALDGLADTHTHYRKNTNWQVVVNNAQAFIAAGGKAIWRMIKFDYNAHQIDECRAMSIAAGFKQFELLYDGRDVGPVYTASGDFDYEIGNGRANNTAYPSRIEIWAKWTSLSPEVRKEHYRTIPIKSTINCHSKREAEIYITATGEVYPCCWIGFYPKLEYKHSWQADNFAIAEIVSNNNANEVGIEAAIVWFNEIESSWQKKAYDEGRLFKCDEFCGR